MTDFQWKRRRAFFCLVTYIVAFLIFIIIVLWSILPIEKVDLLFIPVKYFAVIVPVMFITGLFLLIYFVYPAVNNVRIVSVEAPNTRNSIQPLLQLTDDSNDDDDDYDWNMLMMNERPRTFSIHSDETDTETDACDDEVDIYRMPYIPVTSIPPNIRPTVVQE